MQTKIMERYFFFGLLLATLVFVFFIFKPFWIVLVLGACFATVLYPIQKWLQDKKFPNWFASFLTVLFFTIIICGPLFGVGVMVFNQTQNLYGNLVGSGQVGDFLGTINSKISNVLPAGIDFNIQDKISSIISFISSNIAQIFSTTLSVFASFVLMLLSIFYFLKDGPRWKRALIKLSPLTDTDDKRILTCLTQTINEVVKGYLLVALLQGLLMGLGLAIFGVPNPALWGVVAGIVSLIPTFGTSLISIPAILYLFFIGQTFPAIGLLAWSALLVGLIDNALSPLLIGKKTKLPSFLILFSVLGGVVLLGPVGVIIGPITLSLFYTLISIYRNEFQGTVL